MSDLLNMVRSLGALLTVLGLLAGALWAVRRFNLVLPGTGTANTRRLAVVERLSLDPRRSAVLLSRDGIEHLILLAPEGHLVIESHVAGAAKLLPVVAGPVPPARVPLSLPVAATAFVTRLGSDFGALVDRARRPLARQQPVRASRRRAAKGRHRNA